MPQIYEDMKKLSKFIPHQIHLTEMQIRKLGSGMPVNLVHSQMGADKGDIVVMLKPQNARKMLTSYKKTKGMRLNLNPEELNETLKQGTGFFKTLKKYTGINKSDVISTAKNIGKSVVQHGAEAVGTALGAYMGNPAAGEAMGHAIGKAGVSALDSVSSTKSGITFNPRESIKGLKADARAIAVEAVDTQLDKLPAGARRIAEKALAGEYPDREEFISGAMDAVKHAEDLRRMGGSVDMAEKMRRLRAMKGGKINVAKTFNKFAKDTKHAFTSPEANKAYRQMASYAIHDGIPLATAALSQMAGDPTGMSGAFLGKIASDQIGKATGYGAMGFGIKRGRGRPRKINGEGAKNSIAFKKALKNNFNGLELGGFSADNKAVSSFDTNPRVKASSTEMTLSPYQRMDSPAMNPFIPTTYKQEGGQQCGYGGKGLYAGGLSGGDLIRKYVKPIGKVPKLNISTNFGSGQYM